MNETPNASPEKPGYETTDIHVGGLLAFAGGLIILALLLHFALTGLFNYFAEREKRIKQQMSPFAAEERGQLPPEPRLEGLEGLAPTPPSPLEKATKESRGYAWVDRKAGIVRIPIENAMKILANRLPHRAEKEIPPPRSEPAASSSGRGTGRIEP